MVALGQALFFDRELSGNRDVSCATCHHPRFTTGDAIALSIGSGGTGLGPERRLGQGHEFIARNATELFNRGSPEWTTMFWDNRVNGRPEIGFHSPAVGQLPPDLDNILAAQAMFPVASDEEMRGFPGDLDLYGQQNELGEIIEEDYTAIWDGLMSVSWASPGTGSFLRLPIPIFLSTNSGSSTPPTPSLHSRSTLGPIWTAPGIGIWPVRMARYPTRPNLAPCCSTERLAVPAAIRGTS
jgi:cytochrome c peroxidase